MNNTDKLEALFSSITMNEFFGKPHLNLALANELKAELDKYIQALKMRSYMQVKYTTPDTGTTIWSRVYEAENKQQLYLRFQEDSNNKPNFIITDIQPYQL